MSINQLSASVIQSLGRQVLNLDAEAKMKIAAFKDKIIHIKIEDLNLNYYFHFENGLLLVENNAVHPHSASISGKLNAFLTAAANQNSSDSIFKGELMFSGEISTAKLFQDFVKTLNIDWQEPLAQWFGDPVGHTLYKGMEKFSSWLRVTARSTRTDIAEYLQEEARVTPTYYEQQGLFDEVDQIRSRTDRLNARINQLKTTLFNSSKQTNTGPKVDIIIQGSQDKP